MSIYYKAGFCVYTVNTFSTYIPITKSHYTYPVNRSLWSSSHIISEFCLTSVSLDCWRISWGLEELSVFRSLWRLSRQTRPARRTSSAGPRLTTPVNTTMADTEDGNHWKKPKGVLKAVNAFEKKYPKVSKGKHSTPRLRKVGTVAKAATILSEATRVKKE